MRLLYLKFHFQQFLYKPNCVTLQSHFLIPYAHRLVLFVHKQGTDCFMTLPVQEMFNKLQEVHTYPAVCVVLTL